MDARNRLTILFLHFGPLGLFGPDILSEAAGRDVASYEQTQSDRVCCSRIVYVLDIVEGSPVSDY